MNTARPCSLVALLISIPCLWQQHIQADDLSSHLYNAWLVQQVSAGQLKGLFVAPQFTNVLFDHLLSLLMKSGSVLVTEHVAVLLAVQIFFWGCFAFVSAVAGRYAWDIVPFLMMLAYGAVFRMGFFNFYISVGICLLALAAVWKNKPGVRFLSVPLLLAAYTAHSIPFVWAIGLIAYLIIARRLDAWRRLWLLAGGVLALAAVAILLKVSIPSRWAPGVPLVSQFGADQMLTFGMKYAVPAAGLFCLWVLFLVRSFETRRLLWSDIAIHLWVLSLAACLFLPDAIRLPFYSGSLTYIAIRLSLLSAILLCSIIAGVQFGLLERSVSLALAALFFSFTYVDERAIASVEHQMVKATASLPAGTRVVSTLKDSRLFVPALEHLIDRVCIGRCISYGNYEAASTHFRLRAEPGNPYLLSNADDAIALEHGEYVWQRVDIDLYKLYPCADGKHVCVALVKPGERLVKQEIASVPVWWRSSDRM